MTTYIVFLLLCICIKAWPVQAENCRTFETCDTCLNDPECGWCSATGACANGTWQGPNTGTCPTWDWYSCSSSTTTTSSTATTTTTTTTTTTSHPTTSSFTNLILPQGVNWWTAFGGDDAHMGYKPDTLGHIEVNLRWTANVSTKEYFTLPVIYHGLIYVVSTSGFGNNATLYAFVESTGQQQKSQNLGPVSYAGPPTIGHDNLLYVQTIGANEGIKVFGIQISTFQIQWTANGYSQWATYPYGVASSATYNNVYFPGGEYNGELYAVDSETGNRVFDTAVYAAAFGCDYWTPTIYNDTRVFFSSAVGEWNDAMVGEVNATTGEVEWSFDLQGQWFGYSTFWVPVVANDIVYGVAEEPGGNGTVSAISITNQELLWQMSCAFAYNQDVTVATDGEEVFVTCENAVQSRSALNGSLLREYNCGNSCYGQPIITNDYLIVRNGEEALIFDRTTTAKVHSISGVQNMAYHGGWLFITNDNAIINGYQLITKPFNE